MIVGFDGFFIGQEASAWGATELNLVRQLAEMDQVDTFLVFLPQSGVARLPALPNVIGIVVRKPRSDNALSRTRSIVRATKSSHVRMDLYIETCEISPRFNPTVALCSIEHDFSHGRMERPLSLERLRGLVYRRLHIGSIKRTDAFFCNSYFTLRQLEKYLRPTQTRTVFPHGCDEVFTKRLASSLPPNINTGIIEPGPYFLYVGRVRVRHKNVATLLRAFVRVAAKRPDLSLVIISSQNFSSEQRRIVSQVPNRVHVLRGLKVDEIAHAYSNAVALVLPSTYEGFGIPIIEAQNMRCPVVLNDIEVFREVGGEGALFFNGTVDDLVKKMEFALDRQGLERLVQSGSENCRKFSWEGAALLVKRYLDEKRKVIGEVPNRG
jgi:glycosyltransferase involved in cell wall biosynthesis